MEIKHDGERFMEYHRKEKMLRLELEGDD